MNFAAFMENLKYMGLGMLIIMIVMLVLIAAVLILNKLTGKKK